MDDSFGRIFLTAGLPGVRGRIKERPEDFIVDEVPVYQPAGEGNFLFLLVEKTNLSTLDLISYLRQKLDLEDHEVGLAGWKDKRAVTRQWVSVPGADVSAKRLEGLSQNRIRVVEAKRHKHKLRTGHLLGNRFSVLIRDTETGAESRARAVIERLQVDGLPNFYGGQRFGAAGHNPVAGLQLLLGKRRVRSVRMRKLLISSCTSLLFNLTVKERLEQGLFARLLPGDIAKKHDTGGLFLVDDAEAEQPRADRLEISATGPIWGKKMKRARNAAGALEEKILKDQGLTPNVFGKQRGSRRSLRVPLSEVKLHKEAEGLRLEFFLPKGSYATVLLEEIMKT